MSLATPAASDLTSHQGRKVSRSSRGANPPGDKNKKVSFYLSDDSLKRLGVHATMDGVDRSRLVDQLIQVHLRRYDLPRKRGSSSSLDVQDIGQEGQAA